MRDGRGDRRAPGTFESRRSFWELAPVREPIKVVLRASGTFSDYIQKGSAIWQQVYDWHIRNNPPLIVGKDRGGHDTLALMPATTLIPRSDMTERWVGQPYETRASLGPARVVRAVMPGAHGNGPEVSA